MGGAFMPLPPREVHPAARLLRKKRAELRRLQSPAYACPLPASAGKAKPCASQSNPWEAKMTAMALRHLGRAVTGAAGVAPAAFAQSPAPTAPTAANPWFQGAPFPEASEEVLGATAAGKVYVFAGLAPGWKPKAMVYEYDPASNQWAKKRPMRLASHHVAFATLNDKIYAFGGFTYPDSGPPGWNAVNNAWEYDPATDEWKELAPMPTKRGAAAAGVANGKIYVTGGANSLPGVNPNGIHPRRPPHVVATVHGYRAAANSWKTVRPLLLARNHHAAVRGGGKIYVIAGRLRAALTPHARNNVGLVEMYDPATRPLTA